MDDLWIEYKCKSGQTLFTFNKETGEHKWLNEANNESISFKEFRCIAIQTDDTVCDNGCTSMYVKQDSCSEVPLYRSTSYEELSQTKLDESDEIGQELISIAPPVNKLSYSLEHGETSGIYEVSVVDVLEELHVEYPSESNDEEGESSTDDVGTGTESATERNLVLKNKASDASTSLRMHHKTSSARRNTQISRDGASSMDVKSDEILKDNYVDPSYRIKRFYKCSHCQRQFDSKGKLNDHIRTHTGEKPYECIYCDRKFAKKCNLKRHLRRHTGERNYSCSLCEKKFIDSAELQRHMISHTKKKAFECPYCEKRFAQKNTLTCHLRRHTGIGKSFDCTVCGRQFEHRSDLKRHIRTHTGEKPYGCTYCDKKFPTKYSVNRHIRSHTGEKPFQCSTCEKKFAEKKNLEYHMTIHTGEKRFECSTCEKKFARKLYWDNHRRKCKGTKNLDCSDGIELSHSPLSMVHDFKTSETSLE